jgi:hypothetical protein
LTALPNPDAFVIRDINDPAVRAAVRDLPRDNSYLSMLKTNLVSRVSELVRALRSSGQRREALRQTIIDCNANKRTAKQIPALQLLRQVATRWSSTFLMVDRWLHLTPVRLLFPYCRLLTQFPQGHQHIFRQPKPRGAYTG